MGATVLMVEDNELNSKLMRFLLQQAGHEVLEATTVEEARGVLAEHTPALVLLDIQLPGESGDVLLCELRESEAWKELPVIALTAFAMAGDREKYLEMGFDHYISKPIDVRTFAASIAPYFSAQP